MEYSFPRYLLSKQSVDDRALNKDVLSALKSYLPEQPIRIIEVGAGIGTMLRRLVRWDIVQRAEYVIVDKMAENIEYASAWIPGWATEAGFSVEGKSTGTTISHHRSWRRDRNNAQALGSLGYPSKGRVCDRG